MNRARKSIIVVLLLGLGFGIGSWVQHTPSLPGQEGAAGPADVWTCPMHPQIQAPKPGKCPLCSMDLVKLDASAGNANKQIVSLSPYAQKLAEIETVPVQRKYVEREIRLVGKIEYDETRRKTITAWVPGRIDRLYVDYTGIEVKKNDHLIDLYSPSLITAQQEFLQALASYEQLDESSVLKERSKALVHSSKEKLRLLGLTGQQLQKIEKTRTSQNHLTIFAPMNGVVIEKMATEGRFVETGSPLYALADLSQVWLKLDAYESDLHWLHFGQTVVFEPEAFPGQSYEGQISFIDPMLNPETRTVKVRVNVPNPQRLFKPGMFVRATVRATIANEGQRISPHLIGKFISPMHPEIIKDKPGVCDICGMALVPAEEFVRGLRETSSEPPLVIPATAPLLTGKRAIVYVAKPKKVGEYSAREVVLGPRSGAFYVVREGLKEGELVVVRGAFKLDSEVQIKAGRSMMSSADKAEGNAQAIPADGSPVWKSVFVPYLKMQAALAADSIEDAQAAGQEFQTGLSVVPEENRKALTEHSATFSRGESLADQRRAFADISTQLIGLAEGMGEELPEHLHQVYCPMAFQQNRADWLQMGEVVSNPYHGEAMLDCGVVQKGIQIPSAPPPETEHHHEHKE